MQLSEETIRVLSNFNGINQNILIKQGSTIRTVNPTKTLYAEYIAPEVFPTDIGIYNLKQLLEVLSLFENPNIDVNDTATHLSISDSNSKATIILSDPSNLIVTDKKIKDFDPVLTFTLSSDMLQTLLKGSATLRATHIAFESNDDGNVYVRVYDPKPQNSESNSMSKMVCTNATGHTFRFVFEIAQFKFQNGDYKVEVAESQVCKFTNESGYNLAYWVAQDATYTQFN